MAARKAMQHELTKEMILNAARECFVKDGYQHVTMRSIARKLGYSHGALYYHFKKKSDIFYALVKQDFAFINTKIQSVIENQTLSNEEKLHHLLLSYIEFGLTYPNHYEIMFLLNNEEIQTQLLREPNESYASFAHTIGKLATKQTTLPTIFSVFLSLHGFVAHFIRFGQSYEDAKEIATHHVNFLLQHLI